jgi:predicted PurR-regulated permease PerM
MDRLSKINKILLFTVLIIAILHFGAPFLKPIMFGILLASLMMPFGSFLESKGMNRVFASIISTIVLFIVIGAILFLLVFQLNNFVSEISSFETELKSFIGNIQSKIASLTDLSLERQSNIMQERSEVFLDNIEDYVTQFLSGFIHSVIDLLIILLYVILLLLYRGRIYEFIMMYIRKEKEENSNVVMNKINKVVFQYLWGRVQVMAMLAVMYYIVFLSFGLPYAVLLIIFGTLITIIPYFGPFVSGLIPIIFSFIFFDSIQTVLLFTALIIIVQLIESYVLEPLVIGKEVKLNPLIVIVAVILGGIIWGIAGMVLFVPLFAMIKIISNYSVGLEPIGYLFGDFRESKKNG